MQKMDIKNYLFKKYFVSLYRDLSTLKYWKISPEQIYVKDKERITYLYNAFGNRAHSFYGNAEAEKEKRPIHKYYSADGSVEIKEDKTKGSIDFLFYLGGDPYSAPAVYNSNGEEGKLLFLHRDQLGSIVVITDLNGKLVEARHFDAWGKVLSITDGNGNKLENLLLDRGYTGHEHLASVGLIHMNGRLYDPTLHRFLMPDNYIQDPFNTQSFNRYGYCLNNPLVYNDITGEWFGIDDLIAAVAGGVINLAVNAIQGNVTSLGNGLAYFGIGAAGGLATIYGGPLAGGAVLGLGNNITAQVTEKGWGGIDMGSAVYSTLFGAATSYVGGQIAGQFAGSFSSIASPVLRHSLASALGGGVSGFTINALMAIPEYGFSWKMFREGLKGGAMGAAFGAITGAGLGLKYAKEEGLNPWNGKDLQIEQFARENGFYSDHKGIIYSKTMEKYLSQMENETLDLNKIGGAGFKYQNKIIFSEGHHRMNAAIKYYYKTGDRTYIDAIIKNGNFGEVKTPPFYYPFKTLKK